MRGPLLPVAASLLAGAAAAQPAPAPPPGNDVAEIVVAARPGRPAPLRDAVDYFRAFCFDPLRRTGLAAPPVGDRDWLPLDQASRRQFGVTDPEAQAFGLADRARDRTLLVKVERILDRGGIVEIRCTLVLIGGDEHDALLRRMTALFRGPSTQRHVGQPDGVPRLDGWRQWLWTGMPPRGSRGWGSIGRRSRSGGGTWTVVIDPAFYDSYDYVLGDLKTRDGPGRPLSMLSLAHRTRPR